MVYYLDGFDRLVKERLRIKYYSRYMDDCVLIHSDKEYLKYCKREMECYINEQLQLEFNQKTQISPVKNGVDYLGFHFYLTETGKVIRKVKQQTKYKYKRKLKSMQKKHIHGDMELAEIRQVICSYHSHLSHGHTYRLRKKTMAVVFTM